MTSKANNDIINYKVKRGESMSATIGRNVQILRKQTGLSRAELEEYLEVDSGFIQKLEESNFTSNLTLDVLESLSALFGVSIDTLTGTSIPTNPMLVATSGMTKQELDAISAINRISLNLIDELRLNKL